MPRAPKPIALLKLEKGKLYGAQRARATEEPQPLREVRPRCPRRFSPEERRAWRDFAAILRNHGLLVSANATILELLSTAWVQYQDCSRRVARDGIVLDHRPETDQQLPLPTSPFAPIETNGKGHDRYNLYFLAQRKLAREIEQLAQALGLSSLALAKVGSLVVARRREKETYFDD